MKRFVAIIVACCILHIAHAYQPILAMHGIGSGPGDWKHAAEFVAKYHPGTAFFALPVYEVVESYVALRKQVCRFGRCFEPWFAARIPCTW